MMSLYLVGEFVFITKVFAYRRPWDFSSLYSITRGNIHVVVSSHHVFKDFTFRYTLYRVIWAG